MHDAQLLQQRLILGRPDAPITEITQVMHAERIHRVLVGASEQLEGRLDRARVVQ